VPDKALIVQNFSPIAPMREISDHQRDGNDEDCVGLLHGRGGGALSSGSGSGARLSGGGVTGGPDAFESAVTLPGLDFPLGGGGGTA
jgi:hypothetical protein